MKLASTNRKTPSRLDWPGWVPLATRQYLAHVAGGHSVRRIAERSGQAPSTVSRRVRQIEARRDDPLVNEALDALMRAAAAEGRCMSEGQEHDKMTAPFRKSPVTDEATIMKEARRVLRRLCETGAVLAVAKDMDKAVVLRPGPSGEQTRTAVLDRRVAQAFAVKDWIRCLRQGRIARYEITKSGKSALKRLIEEDRRRRLAAQGFAEAHSPFQAQHATWGTAAVTGADGTRRPIKVNVAEAPLAVIARRKGQDGKPFLSPDLVQAGERLREDFERAQMGPRMGQNWDRFLTGGADRGGFLSDSGIAEGPRDARRRVSDALDDLGPGLADIVLRVCCFCEGMEQAEKRLGWSARSGKVVLKIGLQRLLRHYEARYGFVPALRG